MELPSRRRHPREVEGLRTGCIADAMRHGYLAVEPDCHPETKATELH